MQTIKDEDTPFLASQLIARGNIARQAREAYSHPEKRPTNESTTDPNYPTDRDYKTDRYYDSSKMITGSGWGQKVGFDTSAYEIPFSRDAYPRYIPGAATNTIEHPATKNEIALSENQLRARNPRVLRDNPQWSAQNTYWGPNHHREQLPYKLGRGINKVMDRTWLGNALSSGPLPGAMLGAGIGLLGGGAAGYLKDRVQGSQGSSTKWALLAALAAGGLGAYVGHLRGRHGPPEPKQASFLRGPGWNDQSIKQEIQKILSQASGVDFGLKSQMMMKVDNLSSFQAEELLNLIRTGGGATAGALIAKYLFKAGLLGTLAGGLLGGYIGSRFNNREPASYVDASGRPLFQ